MFMYTVVKQLWFDRHSKTPKRWKRWQKKYFLAAITHVLCQNSSKTATPGTLLIFHHLSWWVKGTDKLLVKKKTQALLQHHTSYFFQLIKLWSCTPQPFPVSSSTSCIVQSSLTQKEANLLAATMPMDIMFACMHTHTYSICKACVPEDQKPSSALICRIWKACSLFPNFSKIDTRCD